MSTPASVRSALETTVCAQAPKPSGAYSHTVRAGDFVFTAGFGPHDPNDGSIPDGVAAQTERVLDHVEAALRGHGLSLEHVVQLRVHLAELERDFAAYDEVLARRLRPPYPVRTTVGSQLLGFLVEIDAVAYAGPPR